MLFTIALLTLGFPVDCNEVQGYELEMKHCCHISIWVRFPFCHTDGVIIPLSTYGNTRRVGFLLQRDLLGKSWILVTWGLNVCWVEGYSYRLNTWGCKRKRSSYCYGSVCSYDATSSLFTPVWVQCAIGQGCWGGGGCVIGWPRGRRKGQRSQWETRGWTLQYVGLWLADFAESDFVGLCNTTCFSPELEWWKSDQVQLQARSKSIKCSYFYVVWPKQSSSDGWALTYQSKLHRDKMLLHFTCKLGNLNATRTQWDAASVVLLVADFIQKASLLLCSRSFLTSGSSTHSFALFLINVCRKTNKHLPVRTRAGKYDCFRRRLVFMCAVMESLKDVIPKYHGSVLHLWNTKQ